MILLNILKINLIYILRTKLLLLLLLLSFVFQFLGLMLLRSISMYASGIVVEVTREHALFYALFMQMFMCTVLAAVLGIWMIPTLHLGKRGRLFLILPINRWMFITAHALTLLAVLVLLNVLMFMWLRFLWHSSVLPLLFQPSVVGTLLLETLVVECLMFGFAFSTMSLGHVATFVLSVSGFIILHLLALSERFQLNSLFGLNSSTWNAVYWVHSKLPPLGNLVYDIRDSLNDISIDQNHLESWMIWFVIFVVLFRMRMGRA